jgi:hypothetical protein
MCKKVIHTWESADFFPGEGKNFPGGTARTYFLPPKKQKDTIFLKKKYKKTFYILLPQEITVRVKQLS